MAIRLCGILAVAALLGTAEALVSAVILRMEWRKKKSEKCASPFRISPYDMFARMPKSSL